MAMVAAAGCGGAGSTDLFGSDASSGQDGPSDASADAPHMQQDASHISDAPPPMDVATVLDTSPPPDVGHPDTGPKLPPILCGSTSCSIPAGDCCFDPTGDGGDGSYSCQTPADPSSCSSEGGTPITCANGADCPGEVCCGTRNEEEDEYLIVQCATSCTPDDNQRLFCDPSSTMDVNDCNALGGTCGASTILPGFTVCQILTP
jgi:hypothetical protein